MTCRCRDDDADWLKLTGLGATRDSDVFQWTVQSVHASCVDFVLAIWGPIYKISYDLSQDYLNFVVRSTYDNDVQRA